MKRSIRFNAPVLGRRSLILGTLALLLAASLFAILPRSARAAGAIYCVGPGSARSGCSNPNPDPNYYTNPPYPPDWTDINQALATA